MSPRRAGWLLTAALLALSSRAAADDSEAERLFKEGRAAMLAGDFATACPKLAESQRLEPHTGTLLNLAACHEREGKVGSAWVEYQKALTAARAEGQADKARLAEQRIAALEPRVPWLRLVASGDRADPKVTLDGAEIAHAALGTDMPVDPGMHVVGGGDGEQRIDLREGERRTITINGEKEAAAKPEHLVVDPPANKAAEPVAERGRWVLHFGTMFGLGWGRIDHPAPTGGGGSGSSYESVDSRTTRSTEKCDRGDTVCEYASTSANGSGLGVQLYAGYAFSDTVDAGLRLLGLLSSDFTAFGFGPSITIHSSDRFSFGAFAVFGDATLQTRAFPSLTRGDYRFVTRNEDEIRGTLAGGLGLGMTASFRLYKISERSELTLDSMPFFLSGSGGHAFVMPVGVGFRYQ